jgi:hypothetical protein
VSAEPVPGAEAAAAAHLTALEAVRRQVESTRMAGPAHTLAPDDDIPVPAGAPAGTPASKGNRWRDAAVLAALDAAVLEGRHATVDALADSYGGLLAYEPGVSPSGAMVLTATAGAERRHRGAFATPRRLADAVARRGIPADILGLPADPLMFSAAGRRSTAGTPATVVDPACGTGALLRAALRRLVGLGVPPVEAATRLHGVELDPTALEVCRAALLADLERLGVDDAQREGLRRRLTAQLVCGEALLGAASRSTRAAAAGEVTREVDVVSAPPAGSVVWHEVFPRVLDVPGHRPDPVTGWRGGFDVVLANPPWERLKVSRRDWAGAPPSGLRDERVRLSAALRGQGRHPLTGHGELNAYLLFVETCWRLLAVGGRACLVVPAGIATDRSAAHLLGSLVERGALERLDILAPEVAAFGGVSARVGVALVGLRAGPAAEPDPTAAARLAADVTWDQLETDTVPQQWSLDAPTLRLVSPNTGSPPPCTSPVDAAMVVAAHRTWDVLVRRGRRAPAERPPPSGEPLGPWQVRLITPLHMTRDAKWFRPGPGEGLLPVWEAKHAGLLDPCGGSALPRYWVPRELVEQRFGSLTGRGWLAGYRNVTTSDAPRTLLPTPLPVAGVGNSLPLVDAPRLPLLLACLASLPLDYLARQKHVGANLNFFKLEQLPVPDPVDYDVPAPWDGSVILESWVLERLRAAIVWDGADLGALRQELERKLGPSRADDAGSAAADARLRALAELDAAHAVLLGWRREELEHAIGTFSALRFRDERLCGSFVTRERILAAFDRLAD